ncbi:MAG: GDP-mannose 4,6-dehydratase [Anaerolineales bacterium]
MRAFITGVDGFAGSHLADHLLSGTNTNVWGCGLSPAAPTYLAPGVNYAPLDLRDGAGVQELIGAVRPDRIFHLAGQAFVPASWEAPWATFEANVRTTLNILEAVRSLQLPARVLIVSSVEVYGSVAPDLLPLTEAAGYRTNSPYSVSKVAQDLLGLSYAVSHQMHTIRVRPLNHIGPRQNERFVAASFASQIAQIEAGLRPPQLKVGDLSARRDFTDVRDIVRTAAPHSGTARHAVVIRGRSDRGRVRPGAPAVFRHTAADSGLHASQASYRLGAEFYF